MFWVWSFAKIDPQFASYCGPGVEMKKGHKILNEEVARWVFEASDEVEKSCNSNQYIRGKSFNNNSLVL